LLIILDKVVIIRQLEMLSLVAAEDRSHLRHFLLFVDLTFLVPLDFRRDDRLRLIVFKT